MSKPNGAAPPDHDPTLDLPAAFVNDFAFGMNENTTRVTLIESNGQQRALRAAYVLPTAVLVDLAQKLLAVHAKIEARAKIVVPQGANMP